MRLRIFEISHVKVTEIAQTHCGFSLFSSIPLLCPPLSFFYLSLSLSLSLSLYLSQECKQRFIAAPKMVEISFLSLSHCDITTGKRGLKLTLAFWVGLECTLNRRLNGLTYTAEKTGLLFPPAGLKQILGFQEDIFKSQYEF